jgi:hypothetical protein
VSFLLAYILRDVSFAEVGSVCRVALREPVCVQIGRKKGEKQKRTVCGEKKIHAVLATIVEEQVR